MKIQFLGHACFKVSTEHSSVVVDPYNDQIGYPPLRVKAGRAVKSHEHGDHSFFEAVEIVADSGDIAVATVDSFHDNEGGAKRGANLIHIFQADGVRAVHLGDLGHMLSPEQVAAIGHVDALMVPVGGFYTIDAAQALELCTTLNPTVIIPMHYRIGESGPSAIASVDEFLALCGGTPVIKYNSDTIDIVAGDAPHIAVLTYNA